MSITLRINTNDKFIINEKYITERQTIVNILADTDSKNDIVPLNIDNPKLMNFIIDFMRDNKNNIEDLSSEERIELLNICDYLEFKKLQNIVEQFIADEIEALPNPSNKDEEKEICEKIAKIIGAKYGDMVITDDDKKLINKYNLNYQSKIDKSDKLFDKKQNIINKLIDNENIERKYGWLNNIF